MTPSISRYVDFYTGAAASAEFASFPSKALAFSSMAQMHHHKSVWDGPLMVAMLNGCGFVNACEVAFGEGTDARLIRDQEVKRWESLYVEARKPAG